MILCRRTQVFASIATKIANATCIPQPGNPDAVAGLELFDALACRGTSADDLVSWNNRLTRVFQIPVDDMQIRAADTAAGDFNQNFTRL